MANVIEVRLRMFVGDRYDGNSLVVTQWFPFEESDSFQVQRDDATIRLWFDRRCLGNVSDVSDDEISRHLNLFIRAALLDITIPDLDDELVQFIYEERDRPQRARDIPSDHTYRRMAERYESLGRRVQAIATETFNRLIDYFRVQKGQYWLDRKALDVENVFAFTNRASAQVRSESYDWVRWCPPPYVDRATLPFPDTERFVSRDEWPEVIAFVRGSHRSDLVLELLTNADRLVAEGHRRSALIEAVTALEVALHRFARTPSSLLLEDYLGEDRLRRLDTDALGGQIRQLGFHASMRYLVPLLLDSSQISDETMTKCHTAISARGNVVHQGQRDLQEDELQTWIAACRDICSVFQRLTDDRPPPGNSETAC